MPGCLSLGKQPWLVHGATAVQPEQLKQTAPDLRIHDTHEMTSPHAGLCCTFHAAAAMAGGRGGDAGRVVLSNYAVTPGQVLYISVGQGGIRGVSGTATCTSTSVCGSGSAGGWGIPLGTHLRLAAQTKLHHGLAGVLGRARLCQHLHGWTCTTAL